MTAVASGLVASGSPSADARVRSSGERAGGVGDDQLDRRDPDAGVGADGAAGPPGVLAAGPARPRTVAVTPSSGVRRSLDHVDVERQGVAGATVAGSRSATTITGRQAACSASHAGVGHPGVVEQGGAHRRLGVDQGVDHDPAGRAVLEPAQLLDLAAHDAGLVRLGRVLPVLVGGVVGRRDVRSKSRCSRPWPRTSRSQSRSGQREASTKSSVGGTEAGGELA